MRDHIRSLSEMSRSAISCYPNAGLPDENGQYHESPESLAQKMGAFAEKAGLTLPADAVGQHPTTFAH